MIKKKYDVEDLVSGVLSCDRVMLARTLRCVDDFPVKAREIARKLYAHRGNAKIIGITGNPGAGKSTLIDRMITFYRNEGKRVAVLAIDPSSPFSGGALLGDRIRMNRHFQDEGVFIRSFATRGVLGGLSNSTFHSTLVLDAAGYDVVIIETVGVGQDEVDIIRLAESVVVVLVPGLGDDVQNIKAGLLEIADIFLINKADKKGVEELERGLFYMMSLASIKNDWEIPIVKTTAIEDKGISELIEAIKKHLDFLVKFPSNMRDKSRKKEIFNRLLDHSLIEKGRKNIGDERLNHSLNLILTDQINPYEAVEDLLK